MLKFFKLITLLVIFSNHTFADKKLIFALDIIRHGDRTPTVNIPNWPYSWPEGIGELTSLGAAQEFALGQKFRKFYIDKYKLLPQNYDRHLIYVRSSDYNRTLMSAQALLHGMYPSKNPLDVLIPIHTQQKEQDLLVPSKKSMELAKEYVQPNLLWQKLEQENRSNIIKWQKLTGINDLNLKKFIAFADALKIRQAKNVIIPNMATEDINQVIKLGDQIIVSRYTSYDLSNLTSKNLYLYIANYLENAAKSMSKLKYILLSAHESTILAFLGGITKPLDFIPPYASDLKILLFRDSQSNQNYVELTLNDESINFSECKEKMCTLTEFTEILRK